MNLPPAPSLAGKGNQRDDRGLCISLDSGFRRNDESLGAMNRAPTKNLPLSALWSPRRAEDGRTMVRPYGLTRTYSSLPTMGTTVQA